MGSLKEEIDAVDCYHQRVATSSNEELNRLLLHNQHEEMEHAIMLLEWLRRNQDGWDEQMRTYLFTNKDLTKVEEDAESGESSKASSDEDLGIGEL